MGWPYQQKPPMGWPLDLDNSINDGLVGFWLFNEGSGNKVFDLSGNGNTGIFGAGAASPIWVSGKFGPCPYFDGGDYIEKDEQIISGYPFTMVGWIKVLNNTVSHCLFSLTNKDADNVIYAIFSYSVDHKANIYARNVGSQFTAGTTTIDDGNWHQIVGVFESATTRHLYVDGKWEATGTDSIAYNAGVNRWSIGRFGDSSASAFCEGLIDIPSIYNCALSASEIALLYREPFCMFKDPAEIPLFGQYYTVTEGGIMTPNTRYWGAL